MKGSSSKVLMNDPNSSQKEALAFIEKAKKSMHNPQNIDLAGEYHSFFSPKELKGGSS